MINWLQASRTRGRGRRNADPATGVWRRNGNATSKMTTTMTTNSDNVPQIT